MRVLITGICGYLGSRLAARLAEASAQVELMGVDNLSRWGAVTNLVALKRLGAKVVHGDLRADSDVRNLPDADWVIDCAANPAVLAGLKATSGLSPQQLVEHNLVGTLHILEYCRERQAGLVLLSTSRVYSIRELRRIPLRAAETRFELVTPTPSDIAGLSEMGVGEGFSTEAPISLYGATKLASEVMALEYAAAFGFPVWVNRCGVIGGPGQFGKIDQGIYSFLVYTIALERPLSFIGYDGSGKQVRDCVLAEDVADLVMLQMNDPSRDVSQVINVGGGVQGAMSLREITDLSASHLGKRVTLNRVEEIRPYDIPYYVSDCTRAFKAWGWRPSHSAEDLVRQTCDWTLAHMDFVKDIMEQGLD